MTTLSIVLLVFSTLLALAVVFLVKERIELKSSLKRWEDRYTPKKDEVRRVYVFKVNGEIVHHVIEDFSYAIEHELKDELSRIKDSVSEQDKVELVRLSFKDSEEFLNNLK